MSRPRPGSSWRASRRSTREDWAESPRRGRPDRRRCRAGRRRSRATSRLSSARVIVRRCAALVDEDERVESLVAREQVFREVEPRVLEPHGAGHAVAVPHHRCGTVVAQDLRELHHRRPEALALARPTSARARRSRRAERHARAARIPRSASGSTPRRVRAQASRSARSWDHAALTGSDNSARSRLRASSSR